MAIISQHKLIYRALLHPAVIERAAHVVTSIAEKLENPAQAMQLLIDSTLKSQGYSTYRSRALSAWLQLANGFQDHHPKFQFLPLSALDMRLQDYVSRDSCPQHGDVIL